MTTITNDAVSNGKSNFSQLANGLGPLLTGIGTGILRYGLVGILLFFGAFKFTAVEAEAIKPLVSNSPLMSWMYTVLSVQAVSNVIGTTEIVFALLMATRFFSAKLSAIGSIGVIGMTLTTLSFLFSTPGAWASVEGFPLPVPAAAGGFLIKDMFLLGGAVLTAGEALTNATPQQTSRG